MISYATALKRILAWARPLATQTLVLDKSIGYYLAHDVVAREAGPRFDQSEMDGYGIRVREIAAATTDAPVRLPVAGVVKAGDPARQSLPRGTVFQIFTGARLPPGVEAVVPQEWSHAEHREVAFFRPVRRGTHIRRRGEEYARGDRLLRAGTAITPPVVGLLASLGMPAVTVHGRPRVSLIVTGNELVSPGRRRGPGQIYDANSHALRAALSGWGIPVDVISIVKDNLEIITQRLSRALARSDVVVTVGGVSVGDYDLVKVAAANLGVEEVFWGVAMKPGRPTYFGVYRPERRGRPEGTASACASTLVFGLPGNPVAALVSFHQFVRPALLRLSGGRVDPALIWPARIDRRREKRPGRLEWVRAVVKRRGGQWIAIPCAGQQSHMLTGLAAANGLLEFGCEETELAAQSPVHVHWLSWGR
jgi:molybdopterin molybdotransferase